MLQLQLKNLVAVKLSKKVTFFLKLLVCCCLVHIGLLVFFFLIAQSRMSLLINTQTHNATVSFIPFLKAAPLQQQVSQTTVLKKDHAVKHVIEEKKVQPKKVGTTLVKKNTIVAPKKNSTTLKKNEPLKKALVKKNIPEKKSMPIKKIEKTVPPKMVHGLKNNKENDTAVKPEQKSVQETIVVGNEERELFVMQDRLKKEILKKWKRPTNIPETAVCQFKVIVHKNGKRDITMEKSSHAIALDISARNFLLTYDFPEQWAGKELSILF